MTSSWHPVEDPPDRAALIERLEAENKVMREYLGLILDVPIGGEDIRSLVRALLNAPEDAFPSRPATDVAHAEPDTARAQHVANVVRTIDDGRARQDRARDVTRASRQHDD